MFIPDSEVQNYIPKYTNMSAPSFMMLWNKGIEGWKIPLLH
jgi:hypothetical protein